MRSIRIVKYALFSLFLTGQAHAAQQIKPFILADDQGAHMVSVVSTVKQKLSANGFDVVGEYSPYETVTIIAVTSDALKKIGRTD